MFHKDIHIYELLYVSIRDSLLNFSSKIKTKFLYFKQIRLLTIWKLIQVNTRKTWRMN